MTTFVWIERMEGAVCIQEKNDFRYTYCKPLMFSNAKKLSLRSLVKNIAV